jgi:hypothetical protein
LNVRAIALASVLVSALAGVVALPASPAGADSFTPITLGISTTPIARLHAPLKISVEVSADPGALDLAAAPLRLRVKLASECGGTFATTPGNVLLDKQLSPTPATGHAYAATLHGSGRPGAYGVQTVCAFLEEQGDNRMFANDTSNQINVSRPCTVDATRYEQARKSLRRAIRQLRRHHTAKQRRLVVKRKRAFSRAHRRAAKACGPGVTL